MKITLTLYRGLNGTNPSAFRVDEDGISVFEERLSEYRFNLNVRVSYEGEKISGITATVIEPMLNGGLRNLLHGLVTTIGLSDFRGWTFRRRRFCYLAMQNLCLNKVMNEETKTTAKIDEILSSGNRDDGLEALGLALSLPDDEDRNLSLLKIARWLVENDDWQKALGAAQLMSDSYEKSEALQVIASKLASIGHLEKAFSVFADAEMASSSDLLCEWQQAELLHHIAKSLREIRAFFKADEVWRKAIEIAEKGQDSTSVQDSLDASSALAEISDGYAVDEKIEKAIAVARKITNVGVREKTLQKISLLAQQIKRIA